MYENGGNDAADAVERDACYAKSNQHFQRAVNKGGKIDGYTPQ